MQAAPRRSWVKRFLIGLLILAPGLLAFLAVWFVNPQTEDISTLGPADAVVLFAGSPDRLETATRLMNSGVAPNLVIPNGSTVAPALCEQAFAFRVLCPDSEEVNTEGEASAIGRVASEAGWSRLIAVTSIYHVRRATTLLGQCFDGTVVAVAPEDHMGRDDLVEHLTHEFVGFLAGAILHPDC